MAESDPVVQSDPVVRLVHFRDSSRERFEHPRETNDFSSGDGGGMPPEMEARIAVLEAHVSHIQTDVTDIKGELKGLRADVTGLQTGLATLTERVAHLPTKGFIVNAVIGLGAFVAVLTALGPALRKFVGLP